MSTTVDRAGVGASAGYRFTMRTRIDKRIGMLSKVVLAISETGGSIVAIDTVQPGRDTIVRDLTIDSANEAQQQKIVDRVKTVEGVEVMTVSDRVFAMHLGGKLKVEPSRPLQTRDDLAMAYTPGVARVSMAIYNDPSRLYEYTIKGGMVGIVTDGSAVLGLGNIGAAAALPVMEGKAVLFKVFANVDAFPICLDTQDPDKIVETVKYLAPVFGGINLEDISAPRCFEVEDRLKEALDIPIFHDDQHGTAIVVSAALMNAAKLVGKRLQDLTLVVSGVGAAGTATTKMLMQLGVLNIIGCDRTGAIYQGRTANMNWAKEWFANNTNPERRKGTLIEMLRGVDAFLGVSAPGLLHAEDIKAMAKDPIIFTLANPIPEIMPDEAAPYAAVIATGRSDYPNQVNNALVFPGVFRGALDCRATAINEPMKLAAAMAIANLVGDHELIPEYVIPGAFDTRVAAAVAKAVERAACETGVARKQSQECEPCAEDSAAKTK